MIKKRIFKKGTAMLLSAGLLLSAPQFVLASPAITNEAEQTESAIHKVANDIKIENLCEYGNDFVADNTNSVLSIPKNPEQLIELQTAAGTLSVKLPHTNSIKSAEEIDGTVVYGSKKDAVDLAVQGIDCENGSAVRSLIVVNDNSAPRKYTFEFDLNKGEKIVSGKDYNNSPEAKVGYLYVVDDKERVTDSETGKFFSESKFCIEPAWAKDKNGKNVPTHYEIHGNKVTQVIEFEENTAFPVVADPAMTGYYYKKANVSYSKKWTTAKRCSDNYKARKDETVTIVCNKSVSFSGSVSGSIAGITTIGVGVTYSSDIGHTTTFKGPSTRYMTYKTHQKVETGTRKKYNMNTRKLVSSNKYTVKRNQEGQYGTKIVK